MAFASGASINGPFFCERMLLCLPLHDELVGSFVVSCLVAKRRLAPRSHWVIPLHPAFTSAVRMIDRIHHDTANGRSNSHVAGSSSLSDGDVLMIEISDLTDGRRAIHVHQSHFARREFHVSVYTFLGDHLCRGAGAASHLSALPGTQFNIVDGRAERNVLQRQ